MQPISTALLVMVSPSQVPNEFRKGLGEVSPEYQEVPTLFRALRDKHDPLGKAYAVRRGIVDTLTQQASAWNACTFDAAS